MSRHRRVSGLTDLGLSSIRGNLYFQAVLSDELLRGSLAPFQAQALFAIGR
jgi:hypothetical protein